MKPSTLQSDERAYRIWQEHVRGKNIFTPNIWGYYFTQPGCASSPIAEVSEGTDFNRRPMFGVSVLVGGKIDTDQSRLFTSKEAALAYVAELADASDH